MPTNQGADEQGIKVGSLWRENDHPGSLIEVEGRRAGTLFLRERGSGFRGTMGVVHFLRRFHAADPRGASPNSGCGSESGAAR